MSYTNETTYYGLPLPTGSDKSTFTDNNTAFQAVDAALHTAYEQSGAATEDIVAIKATVANLIQADVNFQNDLDTEKGKIVNLQDKEVLQDTAIAAVKADAQDMITAYNEPTATSTHAYDVGDFFIYNDVLYKASASIAIGDTIVPDTNCTTTNVTTEIAQTNNDLENYFTSSAVLFTGSVHGGTDVTLDDNINNYHAFAIVDNNADNEATQSINVKYKSNTYPSIVASIVDYNNTAGALVLADIALTSSDGIHYHCDRSVQWNLDGNGISYFSTDQTTDITIMGYN